MYVDQRIRLGFNGVYSAMFSVSNGVKQGEVASPVMFCLYIDELLVKLADSGIGCWFGKFYVGVLAYADDIVLLAPSACVLCYLIATVLHHNIAWSLMLMNLNACCFYL